ncbi:hypothetical protein FRC12_018354 [Ceratobasidium sp. 428]|nr:hypothetical protein FRC12_018354 [Ceratobasidium sp. 428]
MEIYLRERLHTPEKHIIRIHNRDATRQAIIEGLCGLANDGRIQKHDPILIFYAGHGCELAAPANWETNGQKIQAIIPCDAGVPDATGEPVHVLPDRTIGSLLDDIARKKGDNITVIFDCCHSASGARVDELIARTVNAEDLLPLPSGLDSKIIPRALKVPVRFSHTGIWSHVLLAACGASEVAYEHKDRGVFTSALLAVLNAMNVDKLTYNELIKRLCR